MKSDVSGTNLVPAKRRTWHGWLSWSNWRTTRLPSQAKTKGCAPPAQRPLVLIGTFEDRAALGAALLRFSAAAFTSSDIYSLAAAQPVRTDGAWWKLRRCIGFACAPEADVPDEAGVAAAFGLEAERLLASGGGLVLVRSPGRFHEACEIIQRAGGRIGVPRAL